MEFKLIALDMDGTLLNAQGRIPPSFWDVLVELKSRGITVAPASGRQLATLRTMFTGSLDPGTYIAENGTCVFHEGEVVSTTLLEPAAVHSIINACHNKLDLVICTPDVAYLHPSVDAATTREIDKYYVATETVSDLHSVADSGVIKVAVFTPHDAEAVAYPVVKQAAPGENVVVSGKNWIDVMSPSAGKGRALSALAETLGINISETLAFGDYLNDYDLLETAGTSYAMENAHPDILALADRIAPPNSEEGVVTVLRDMLAR